MSILKSTCIVLILLMVLPSVPCYAQSTTTSFGTNVEPSLYYNSDFMFVDILLHSGGWSNSNNSPTATFTAGPDGMLTSGSATDNIYTGGLPDGTYQFYGQGAFTIDFRGMTLVPGSYQTVNNVTTALLNFTNIPDTPLVNENMGGILIDCTVTDTTNPPKNFHLIAPGYPAYPNNPTFSQPFLSALAPFTCMRMMDYMNTNQPYNGPSTPVTWASRPSDTVFGCFNAGQSYENMIRHR
jgi:hypothetical protein